VACRLTIRCTGRAQLPAGARFARQRLWGAPVSSGFVRPQRSPVSPFENLFCSPLSSSVAGEPLVAQPFAGSPGPNGGGSRPCRFLRSRVREEVVASDRQLPYAVAVWPNNSFERTRSAFVARFAVRRRWRAAQLAVR
jgi:hypothetical protein